MPRGVPYRVHVVGKGSRAYTFTEIADGTGLSPSLVSLIFNRKRRITPYAATRLTSFFGISIEELSTPGTIAVETPPVRPPRGRAVYRITPNTIQRFGRPPVLDRRYASSHSVEPQESEPSPRRIGDFEY